ncbi:MAG: M42 family metallopeptidase [Limnochordales bacterium]
MQAKYADSQRLEQLIRRLAPLYGPSGREEAVRAAVIDLVKPLADEVTVDALGNVIARRRGAGGPAARRVMVAAHMDEIGVIVTHIDDNGFLRFAPVGGVGPATLLGQQVVFDNGVVGAVGIEKVEGPKDIHLDKLFIDIGASSKQEAEKYVRVGSCAAYLRDVAKAGSRLIGKAMDDRVGCAVAIEALHQLKDDPGPNDVYFVFTVQEEVGLRGARTSAYAVEPDVAIAVDVTATGDTPNGQRLNMKLGGGVAIKVKDRSLITHRGLRELLVQCAEEEGIPYQMEVLPSGGTDAGAIHVTRTGVPSGVLSIPTRYLHTPAEMVDLADVAATADLLTAALRRELNVGASG